MLYIKITILIKQSYSMQANVYGSPSAFIKDFKCYHKDCALSTRTAHLTGELWMYLSHHALHDASVLGQTDML